MMESYSLTPCSESNSRQPPDSMAGADLGVCAPSVWSGFQHSLCVELYPCYRAWKQMHEVRDSRRCSFGSNPPTVAALRHRRSAGVGLLRLPEQVCHRESRLLNSSNEKLLPRSREMYDMHMFHAGEAKQVCARPLWRVLDALYFV